MDVSQLKPGEDYDTLPESYVIFICTFDPFGKGLYKYTKVKKKISTENNIEVLDKWIKLAAGSKSIEEFEKKM